MPARVRFGPSGGAARQQVRGKGAEEVPASVTVNGRWPRAGMRGVPGCSPARLPRAPTSALAPSYREGITGEGVLKRCCQRTRREMLTYDERRDGGAEVSRRDAEDAADLQTKTFARRVPRACRLRTCRLPGPPAAPRGLLPPAAVQPNRAPGGSAECAIQTRLPALPLLSSAPPPRGVTALPASPRARPVAR